MLVTVFANHPCRNLMTLTGRKDIAPISSRLLRCFLTGLPFDLPTQRSDVLSRRPVR